MAAQAVPRRRQRRCSSSSWPELHPELLGLVLGRLPSLADRARAGRAVCRPWRLAAGLLRPLAPPPFPWLTLLDGRFLCVPGGEILRRLVPRGAVCYGSAGDWLFLVHAGKCCLFNPFTRRVVRLPGVWDHEYTGGLHPAGFAPMFYKLTPLRMPPSSEPPTTKDDKDPVFAMLIALGGISSVISIVRPSVGTAVKAPHREYIRDIAFFRGKLYAISNTKLFALDVDPSSCRPKRMSMDCVAKCTDDSGSTSVYFPVWPRGFSTCTFCSYLVEYNGRLLHVRRLLGVLSSALPRGSSMVNRTRTFSFQVFEADFDDDGCCRRWRRITSLGGQALFVGKQQSKSLAASECGASEDCVYFMCDYDLEHRDADPFRDSGVFHMKDGTITPLVPEITNEMRPQGECFAHGFPAWFFPTAAM